LIAFLRRYASPLCIGLAAVIVTLHVWTALSASLESTTTFDEMAHMTAGRAYWEWNDFRLQPENGNLPQRWEALPNWIAGDNPPSPAAPEWKNSNVWQLGQKYFYEQGNPLEVMLFRSRAMNLLWNVGTACLIFAWSWRLFGKAGAFVSLILFCADPNFIAHGALATSDACAAFFLLAATGAWWRHLRKFDWTSGILSAVTFGLACAAKFSAVLLLPIMGVLIVCAVLFPDPDQQTSSRRQKGRRIIGFLLSWLTQGLTAVAIIWAFFGFRFSPAATGLPPFEHFHPPWDMVLPATGFQGPVIAALRARHFLPEAFLYGYSNVLWGAQARSAFAAGEFGTTGWWWFFPFAFLVKTPLATLVAFGSTGILAALGAFRSLRDRSGIAVRRLRGWFGQIAPLLMLAAVYGIVTLTSGLNIGQRHLLPFYPPLFILAGALGWWAVRRGLLVRLATVGLVAGTVASAAMIYPHPIAFFNLLAGGPDRGWRSLGDSSLDWGQDLPGLAAWLDKNRTPDETVYLSYFGSGEPKHFGIRAVDLTSFYSYDRPQSWYKLGPGIYCISATMLQQIYSEVHEPWTSRLEAEFEALRSLDHLYQAASTDSTAAAALVQRLHGRSWMSVWSRYDALRFARLCYYLRSRKPDAKIGWSLFIYRLTAAEIARTVQGSVQDWSKAVEAGLSRSP
jgi:4-amino-4-deoxy-L-arabinose transferase-like glycosyltransferase